MITAPALSDLAAGGVQKVALACGVFDGVHRGHQHVLTQSLELAERTGALPVVLTFDPHPRRVLDPHNAPLLLTDTQQKLCLFRRYGMEATVLLHFTPELAALGPSQFLERHLTASGIRLAGVCVGMGWRFGARGAGNVSFLRQAGEAHDFEVVSVEELLWYGKPVSSTRIRQALESGRLRAAERMLGRPYALCGPVVPGRGLGAGRFDCPTANLSVADRLLPPDGVYAARAGTLCEAGPAGSRRRDGVAYVGTAPTVAPEGSAQRVLEFHLFDTTEDLYGRSLEVEFLARLRPDRRFVSLDALAAQMKADIARAREICRQHPAAGRQRPATPTVASGQWRCPGMASPAGTGALGDA